MFSVIKISLRAIRRNFMRSVLTMLGIIVGISAVIVGVSMGTGAKAQVDTQIASMGNNLLLIFSGNTRRGGVRGGFGADMSLTQGDYDAIRSDVIGVEGASPEVRGNAQVQAGNENTPVSYRGVSEEFIHIRAYKFLAGENFTSGDVRGANKVCLLGNTTASTLFGEGNNPVGQIIRINNAPFTVLGWLAPKGANAFGSDQDDLVLVPYTSAMKRLSGDTKFRSISIQAQSSNALTEVESQLEELLRQRHRITDPENDDFVIRTQQEFGEFANSTNEVMSVIIGAFAGISLVVGGIGIMNIMLVSVTERTREIGIRMAVGARGSDVLRQFLTEAIVLSVMGGALGIAAGYWLAPMLTRFAGFPTLISQGSVVLAFSVSALIGVVFGFFPALKAANLDPIDALRYE